MSDLMPLTSHLTPEMGKLTSCAFSTRKRGALSTRRKKKQRTHQASCRKGLQSTNPAPLRQEPSCSTSGSPT